MDSRAIWQKIQKGVFVIAELGKNFIQTEEDQPVEVYLENAMRLVDEAAKAGADAVKFQTHNVEDEILDIHIDFPHFPNWEKGRRAWIQRNTQATPIKGFWLPIKKYCARRGIVFFSTPMSRGAAKILNEVGVDFWKVGSGDILDFVLLDYLRNSGKPIILSSGMSTLEEVEKAVDFLREKNNRVALLHCVSRYPCPPENLQLQTIRFYKEKFSAKGESLSVQQTDISGGDMPVGFSDHSIESIEPPLAAVAMGATILEKHFSMSRKLWGPDHKASLEPKELKVLIKGVRELERNPAKKKEILASDFVKCSLGTRAKILQEGEAVFRPLFRKSLMAGRDIPAGTILTADMAYAMRPQQHAGGLSSEQYEFVVGKKLNRDLKKYDPIDDGAIGE